jgi:hypothetical protein
LSAVWEKNMTFVRKPVRPGYQPISTGSGSHTYGDGLNCQKVYKSWSYLTWLINILGGRITPMPKKGLIIWFVNHSFVKTDQPITRSNGSPRFVKLVENSGWLMAKSFN